MTFSHASLPFCFKDAKTPAFVLISVSNELRRRGEEKCPTLRQQSESESAAKYEMFLIYKKPHGHSHIGDEVGASFALDFGSYR